MDPRKSIVLIKYLFTDPAKRYLTKPRESTLEQCSVEKSKVGIFFVAEVEVIYFFTELVDSIPEYLSGSE
jgi:hypothetical protein